MESTLAVLKCSIKQEMYSSTPSTVLATFVAIAGGATHTIVKKGVKKTNQKEGEYENEFAFLCVLLFSRLRYHFLGF